MKIPLWIICTCCLDDGRASPARPEVHPTEAAAEAAMDALMRAEWDAYGLMTDEALDGTPAELIPYPDDWRRAQDKLKAHFGSDWSEWEITAHEVAIDLSPPNPMPPNYPVEDWQYEVANGDTMRGYADWCAAKAEAEAE